MPALWRQRQVDLSEFQVSLVYRVSSVSTETLSHLIFTFLLEHSSLDTKSVSQQHKLKTKAVPFLSSEHLSDTVHSTPASYPAVWLLNFMSHGSRNFRRKSQVWGLCLGFSTWEAKATGHGI